MDTVKGRKVNELGRMVVILKWLSLMVLCSIAVIYGHCSLAVILLLIGGAYAAS